jgi:hypothetical protein
LAVSRFVSGPPLHTPSAREQVSYALIAGRIAWFVLGVLDMHVFGLIHVPNADLAFHGAGPVAALIGVALAAIPASSLTSASKG